MPIISSTERGQLENAIQDHFEAFSEFHNIVVVKEPIKQIVSMATNIYAGYDNNSNLDNIIYVPVSGVFPCVPYSPSKDISNTLVSYLPMRFQNADKIIKVKEDAKNYIEQGGQVERIILDNNEVFSLQSKGFEKKYNSISYYYFAIQKTS